MRKHTVIDIIVLLCILAAAALSITSIGTIHIDSSTDAFMPQQSSVVKINDEIERRFGSTDAIVIGVSVNEGSNVLQPQYIEIIKALTDDFAAADSVGRVVSITNADHIIPGPDGMEVVPLFDNREEEPIENLIEKLEQWPQVYDGNLISSDRSMAAVIVQPVAGSHADDIEALLNHIRSTLKAYEDKPVRISIVGLPVVKNEINRSLVSDLSVLVPIVAFIIITVLFLSFRRLNGVIFPLVSLAIAASLIIGLIALFRITFTMATMLVPVLLLIVGSAYAIHLMSHFYEEIDRPTGLTSHETIKLVVRTNVLPIIMAGTTTIAGFVAQLSSPLAPFRMFGILSAAGVVLTQCTALILLPIMLRLTYRNGVKTVVRKPIAPAFRPIERVLSFCQRIMLRHRRLLVIMIAVVAILLVAAVFNIDVGTNMLDFFHKDSILIQDTTLFNERMGGAGVLAVMIEGSEPADVLDPSFLNSVDEFSTKMQQYEAVGSIQTVVPYIKRINFTMNWDTVPYEKRETVSDDVSFDFFSSDFSAESTDVETLNETRPAVSSDGMYASDFLEIPTDPAKYGLDTDADLKALISQFLVMYAGNLSMFIDDALEPTSTLLTIQLRDTSDDQVRHIVRQTEIYWEKHLPDSWQMSIGGGDAVSLALVDLVTRSQILSLISALAIVWIITSLMYRSPIAGFFTLVPVFAALSGVFIAMAAFNIHLDIITSLLAAIAIGTGVDYAIHFISACKRMTNGEATCDFTGIYRTTGKAISINALSVTLGFLGLVFSRFIPIQQMGILFAVSTICAAVASLTILPMLISIVKPAFLGMRIIAEKSDGTIPKRSVMR